MRRSKDLHALLEAQCIPEDSDEMRELQKHRATVEETIQSAFPRVKMSIRYAGSIKKGTMIKESYDLDMIVYAHHDEKGLGETLEEIYKNVGNALSESYSVEPKTSALRLYIKGDSGRDKCLFIDVVPGWFVDATKGDAFIFQSGIEKSRLKTNLQVHIDHIKDSGAIDALKLIKLMRVRHDLKAKQFGLDLLTVALLEGKTDESLDSQFAHVLESIRDADAPIEIKDPANPFGNDLSDLLVGDIWIDLKQVAKVMLDKADTSDWRYAFGQPDDLGSSKATVIGSAAESVNEQTRPWAQ